MPPVTLLAKTIWLYLASVGGVCYVILEVFILKATKERDQLENRILAAGSFLLFVIGLCGLLLS